MLKATFKSAYEPFEFTNASTGEVVKGVADFRDHNLTKARKAMTDNIELMQSLSDQLDDDEEKVLGGVAEAVRPLLTLVLGEKAYKQLVKSMGGREADSATQLMEIYVLVSQEVSDRLSNDKSRKAAHYLQQDEA